MIGARLSKLFGTKQQPTRDARADTATLRLLIACDQIAASQEIHLLRPLARARARGDIGLTIYPEAVTETGGPDWIAAAFDRTRPHALIFSRFAGASAPALCDAARAHGVPIVTHLDDFLLEVPPDVGAAKAARHMRPERLGALTETLRQAELLYISTAPLADKVRAAGFTSPLTIAALQSCVDPDELAPAPTDDSEIRIGYQGTASHKPDLALIAPALLDVLKTRPQATLTLFGTIEPPEALATLGSRLRRIAAAPNYAAFLDQLRAQRWHIGLAPLCDTPFNSFRTYTKWTEYTIAGAAVLATDCLAYRPVLNDGAGMLLTDNAWRDALLKTIDDATHRRAMVAAAQAKARTELNLQHQEQQVRAMLRQAGVGA